MTTAHDKTDTGTYQRFQSHARPGVFAAPARPDPVELTPEEEAESAPAADDGNLHELFEAWSHWSRTRRYYAPPPASGTILGRLSSKTRPFSSGPPDAACNMDMAALHLAIIGQPRDALDTRVFQAYYGDRAVYIKRAAEDLGISRVHFYRLLKAFCIRVHASAQAIASENRALRDALPHHATSPD